MLSSDETKTPMISSDPFARLPEVPSFAVASTTAQDGRPLPPAQLSGHGRLGQAQEV